MGAFGWSEQPEETDDDEVVSDGVEDTPFGVIEVEGVAETPDDGEVDWVGSVFGFVFALESPEEIQEYGPEGSVSLLSGIWLTQVGDPLGHGGTNGISSDRPVGEAIAAVAEGEDEEVREAALRAHDITEGWLDVDAGGEVGPVAEGSGLRAGGLAGVGAE